MTHDDALAELKRCIKEQDSITTKKLDRLFQTMNFSLEENHHTKKEKYLTNEIKNLHKHIRRLKKQLRGS